MCMLFPESSHKIMKLKYITTALAATSLSIFSANADHHEQCEKEKCDKSAKCEVTKTVNTGEATEEAAAVETVTAYKVVFKGKG